MRHRRPFRRLREHDDAPRQAVVVVTPKKSQLNGLLSQIKEKFGCGPKLTTRRSMRASASKHMPTCPTRFVAPGGGPPKTTYGRWKAVFELDADQAGEIATFVREVTNEDYTHDGYPLTEALDKSCSVKAFEKNISTEMDSGTPQDQALAIAFNTLKSACGVETDERLTAKEIVARGKNESTERGREMDNLSNLLEQTEMFRLLLEQAESGFDEAELRESVMIMLDAVEQAGTLPADEVAAMKSEAEGAGLEDLFGIWTELSARFPFLADSLGPTGTGLTRFTRSVGIPAGPDGVPE